MAVLELKLEIMNAIVLCNCLSNIFSLFCSHQGTASLRMVHVSVPQYPEVGQSVELLCQYELQGEKLYSVSWYKDFSELYRFVPRGSPKQHVYWIDGIKVDVGKSDAERMVLLDVSLRASGLYMCEVSAEAPSFASIHGQAWMSVIVLPLEGPRISGGRAQYRVGEELSLNCSAGPSHPATRLQWFLNDKQEISQTQLTHRHNQLLSSSARLLLKLRPEHFQDGRLNIRCIATLPTPTYPPANDLNYQKETSLLLRGATGRPTFCQVLLALSLAALTSS